MIDMSGTPGLPGDPTRCVQLSEFLAAVSAARTTEDATSAAVHAAASAFDAAIVALIDSSGIVDAVGLPDVVPVDDLVQAARHLDGVAARLEVAAAGTCEILA